MRVIHSVIKNTNDYPSSRDSLSPNWHHIEVDASWTRGLALI